MQGQIASVRNLKRITNPKSIVLDPVNSPLPDNIHRITLASHLKKIALKLLH